MLTATDNVTELDISELVDMESEPGCEHSGHPLGKWNHSGPAWAVVRFHPHCREGGTTLLICEAGYKYGLMFGVKCTQCNTHREAEDAWELVQIL